MNCTWLADVIFHRDTHSAPFKAVQRCIHTAHDYTHTHTHPGQDVSGRARARFVCLCARLSVYSLARSALATKRIKKRTQSIGMAERINWLAVCVCVCVFSAGMVGFALYPSKRHRRSCAHTLTELFRRDMARTRTRQDFRIKCRTTNPRRDGDPMRDPGHMRPN